MRGEIVIGAGGTAGGLFATLLEQSRQAALIALRATAVDLHRDVVVEMDASTPYPPIDTGVSKRSWRFAATPDGAVVENPAPQTAFMEFGTKPHTPPLAPLLAWARRKARGGNIKSVFALAKGAQRSISIRGTAPRHFWKRALAKVPDNLERNIRDELARASGGRP